MVVELPPIDPAPTEPPPQPEPGPEPAPEPAPEPEPPGPSGPHGKAALLDRIDELVELGDIDGATATELRSEVEADPEAAEPEVRYAAHGDMNAAEAGDNVQGEVLARYGT